MKRLLLALLAASFFAVAGNAQVTVNVNRTAANSGKMMFNSYCAPCHGINGRGDGPAAASLKIPPADLTLLSQNNRGQFPDAHTVAVLRFGTNVPAHGTAEMPVWGPVLSSMASNNDKNSAEEMLRVSNLVHYLQTMQAK